MDHLVGISETALTKGRITGTATEEYVTIHEIARKVII
jgi:hypothetical protein